MTRMHPASSSTFKHQGFIIRALGHIHKTAIHEGETTVVMPGIPQGRDIGEAGVNTPCWLRSPMAILCWLSGGAQA